MESYKLYLSLLFFVLVKNIFFVFYLLGPSVTSMAIREINDFGYSSVLVSDEKISADSEKVVLYIDNPYLIKYTPSKSMGLMLGVNSTGIGVKPDSPDNISVGNIISFFKDNSFIAHRVVKKGEDSNGIYFITRGDNNLKDDGKIRFEEIDSVLVAIVY